MGEYVINFNKIGSHVGTRITGASIREKIEQAFKDGKRVIFDFEGVASISPSFADECFAKLLLTYEYEQLKEKSTFRNTSPFIKRPIENAFVERLADKVIPTNAG
jgi:hypothetical protein